MDGPIGPFWGLGRKSSHGALCLNKGANNLKTIGLEIIGLETIGYPRRGRPRVVM
jgi:hypothetical protein